MPGLALRVPPSRRLGGCVDADRAAALAVFHDVPEIITGDLPTPVKYFSSDISRAYKEVESSAVENLLSRIPADMRDDYEQIFICVDAELLKLVKLADKISALIKCIEERNSGNTDFIDAEKQTLASIKSMGLKEADIFLNEFLPAYELTLDEQA